MTCAHAVRVAVQKVDGVEAVDVSLERKAADIRLRAGNRVTLNELRQIVQRSGFTAKEAVVTVRGILVERGGKPALAVSGLDTVWRLAVDPAKSGAHADAVKRLAGHQAETVELVGVVSPPATASQPEEIRLQSIAIPSGQR